MYVGLINENSVSVLLATQDNPSNVPLVLIIPSTGDNFFICAGELCVSSEVPGHTDASPGHDQKFCQVRSDSFCSFIVGHVKSWRISFYLKKTASWFFWELSLCPSYFGVNFFWIKDLRPHIFCTYLWQDPNSVCFSSQILKGIVVPNAWGFSSCQDRSGIERKPTGFLIFMLILRFLPAIIKFWSASYQNISKIPGMSKMDLQMWARVLEISYLLLEEPLARCKFFW